MSYPNLSALLEAIIYLAKEPVSIDAIHNQRPCVPSFHDGARAQAVMDAAVKSAETKQWVDLP